MGPYAAPCNPMQRIEPYAALWTPMQPENPQGVRLKRESSNAMEPYGWWLLFPNAGLCSLMEPYAALCSLMQPYGALCSPMHPYAAYGALCSPMDSYAPREPTRSTFEEGTLEPYGALWALNNLIEPYGTLCLLIRQRISEGYGAERLELKKNPRSSEPLWERGSEDLGSSLEL